MKFLYSAYAVTWIIHIGYVLYLRARYQRIREDARELDRR